MLLLLQLAGGMSRIVGVAMVVAMAVAQAAHARKPGPGAKEFSAREILDYVDDLYRGDSSHAKMTMKVVTAHWSRQLQLEMWSLGKEKSLVRILAPRKEKGMATLKSGNNMWNYLPKVKRVIKIPSSMMGGSWMGSHFTNDDIVRESRMADDYDFSLGKASAKDKILLVCIPKKEAAVVWGKVTVEVRREDWMPLTVKYFDEDMRLARTMTFSDLRDMGGRLVPALTRMVPADKPEESTEFRYEELQFDVSLKDSLFTLRSLQR